jgi:hypothetical protein
MRERPDREEPGVPEAGPRALAELLARVPAERIDGVWRFPPLRKGRKESGLLVAALYLSDPEALSPENPSPVTLDSDDPRARRILVTLAWRATETGKGVEFEAHFQEEGEAPVDRLPRVMEGVARRMDEGAGIPHYLFVGGNPNRIDTLRKDLEDQER